MKQHLQVGWGRTNASSLACYTHDEFDLELKSSTSSALPIGLGRSYGDSSISATGIYLKVKNKQKIDIDTIEMVASCSADVTIGNLERAAIVHGLFPPTVPGTEFVTIGGAIASNVHGKSHHREGSFGNSVLALDLLTSDGKIVNLKPEGSTSDYFWATIGGMGLTGVITGAKIRLKKVETSYVSVEEARANNLDELLSLIEDFDKTYLYTVAWIDLSGKFSGRGIVSGGNHASISELSSRYQKKPLLISYPSKFNIPPIFPSRFINRGTVKFFNHFWFKKPLVKGIKPIRNFLHPLDSIGNWNRIYGGKGLLQVQFQIPFGQENFLYYFLETMKKNRLDSFLSVLKKFGNADPSLLGFPSPGWTMAIDFPAHRLDVYPVILQLMSDLIDVNGKVYLAKDSLMSQELFHKMYKNTEKWKQLKHELDLTNYWQSDQGRRLGLC